MSSKDEYDVIVVGGGPGGLTAGIWCAERGLKTLILEGGAWGGLLTTLYPEKIIPNYPGFPEGIRAKKLVKDWLKQAKTSGVEMKNERVLEITPKKAVKTTERKYRGKVIVIATGNRSKELGIPGEANFNEGDKGVYYYVTDPKSFAGKRVLVVGGGDSAVDAVLDLIDIVDKVTIVHRKDKFRALEKNVKKAKKSPKINILMNTEVKKIKGEEEVKSVVLWNPAENKEFELEVDKVILAVGLTPNNEIFEKLGLEMDRRGLIITDVTQKTNIKGIYAVGDITSASGGFELIVVAVAQGALAACHAYLEVMQPYWA